MNLSLKILFTAITICCTFGSFSYAHCINGISNWSDLITLSPVNNLNINDIHDRKSLHLKSTSSGDKYTLRERRGMIYVQTPSGNANVKLCRLSRSQLQITATILGSKKTVVVSMSSRNKGSIRINDRDIPFEATY